MKLMFGILILSSAASLVVAQEAPQPAQNTKAYEQNTKVYEQNIKVYEETKAKLIAEFGVAQRYATTVNSPFSAEEVNESVQTLADGNRIVRRSSGKMYRNSDGRVRREMTGGLGGTMANTMGVMGTLYSTGQGISIATPVAGHLLSTNLTTARVVEMPSGQAVTITSSGGEMTIAQKRNVEERMKVAGAAAPVAVTSQGGLVYSSGASATATMQGGTKYDVKTEELGTRDFEGVSAQGTRRTTTIPADAIGNERPIEIVYERWHSKDLGLVVYSKNSDPRFGDQIYKLTNIVRAEPDPSLFAIPVEGKKLTGEPATVYRVVEGKPIVVNTTKPATVSTGGTVNKVKP